MQKNKQDSIKTNKIAQKTDKTAQKTNKIARKTNEIAQKKNKVAQKNKIYIKNKQTLNSFVSPPQKKRKKNN